MRIWVVAALLSGCFSPTFHDGTPCGPEGECPSGYACSAGACYAIGAADAPADAGLVDVPAGSRLHPSNGVDPAFLVGAGGAITGNSLVFHTDTGAIAGANGNTSVRPPGDGIVNGIAFTVVTGQAVFSADSITLPSGTTWTATGGNALVLFAATTIDVEGTLDVGATTDTPGPGGVTAASGCTGGDGDYQTDDGGGGGGAGGATAGGDGAMGNAAQGGAGGATCGQPSTRPLVGANHGGDGAQLTHGGAGAFGGGAVALVAMTNIVVGTTGIVGSPGGAGASRTEGFGGGGGGAGGAVFLESPTIRVDGFLSANGGGGGSPSIFLGNSDAERGHLADATPAAGGTVQNGAGGNGGAGTTAPTAGTTASILAMYAGGGGGGSVGTIEVRALAPSGAGSASPPPFVSQAIVAP